jgi:hypothetical protein
MMPEGSLQAMDRDVAHADAAWTRWSSRLSSEAAEVVDEDPLAPWRHVAGARAYESLCAPAPSAADEPWRSALARWVYELTQRRVSREPLVAWALAADDRAAHLYLDRPSSISYKQAWKRAVIENERKVVAACLDAAAERGAAVAPFARAVAERRVEVARRLGLAHPYALATSLPHQALRALALQMLDATADLASDSMRRHKRSSSAPDAVDALIAVRVPDAREGWPPRLTVRWLEGLFGALGKGLSLRVAVPSAVGASSFARALGAFGQAFRVAGSSRSLPFALAHDPFPVDAHRFGLVFAAIPASLAFQRRCLGNVTRIARSQARSLAEGALFAVRAIAVRALLVDEMEPAGRDLFEHLTAGLFGGPLAQGLRGAWPRAAFDEWTRLLALVTAAPLAEELVERFDEDWFMNPRAVPYLRARASAPARDPADAEAPPTTAVRHLAARLEQALG